MDETSQQQQQQPDFGPRVKGAQVSKPIVFGNSARHFGEKRREDGHTHEWTIYLRSFKGEDMSTYIKKVHFKLHESYVNPIRIVTNPPYEVSETGWGEFEVMIKIYFVDPAERPVTIYHILKLFKPGTPQPVYTDYLVSEFYDELIFAEPSTRMHQLLTSARQLPPQLVVQHETDFEQKRIRTLESILQAKKKVRQEIEDLRRRIQVSKAECVKYQTEITSGNSVAGGGGQPVEASTS